MRLALHFKVSRGTSEISPIKSMFYLPLFYFNNPTTTNKSLLFIVLFVKTDGKFFFDPGLCFTSRFCCGTEWTLDAIIIFSIVTFFFSFAFIALNCRCYVSCENHTIDPIFQPRNFLAFSSLSHPSHESSD